MKINKAEIIGFGKWQHKTIEFTEGNQLFFGLNEAGKSTIYQFITAMLFGFPTKSKKNRDFTPKTGGTYGGRLWIETALYGELMIERFKNKNHGKASVVYEHTIMEEVFLQKALEPLTEETFRKVFTLNQEQLSQLEQLREEELHEALISLGVSGSADLFQERQRYLTEGQKIFKRRGMKQPLNVKLKEWQKLQTLIRQKTAEEADFGLLEQQKDKVSAELNRLKSDTKDSEKKLASFEQQKVNWPQYLEWQRIAEQLKPEIPDADADQLSKLYQAYQKVTERIEELKQQRSEEESKSSQPNIFYFYLNNEEKIKALESMETAVIRSQERIDQRRLTDGEQERLADLGKRWSWSKEQLPIMPSEEQINSFTEGHQSLLDKKNQLEIRLEMAEEQRNGLEQDLSAFEGKNVGFARRKERRKSSIYLLWYGVAAITLVLGIFLSRFRIPLLAVCIGFLAAGIYQMMKSNTGVSKKKRQWQQKLAVLDTQQGKVESIRQNLNECANQLDDMETNFQQISKTHHLGNRMTLESFREGINDLEHYLFYLNKQHLGDEQSVEAIEVLHNYEEQAQLLKSWLPLRDKNYEAQFQEIHQFVRSMEELRYQQNDQQVVLLQRELQREQQMQQQLLGQLEPIMKRNKVAYPSELSFVIEEKEKRQRLKKRQLDLEPTIQQIFPVAITEADLQLQTVEEQQNHHKLQQKFEEQLAEQERLQIKIDTMEKSGTLDSLYQQADQLKSEISELAVDWGKYRLADLVLGDLSTEMSQQQLPQLLERAGHYLSILTNQLYGKLSFTDSTLLIANDTQHFSIYELSSGTRDQVVMALRFAFLSLEQQRELSPVIVDDGWLHYDFKRKRQLAELFAEFGSEHQIICFSSDREMVSYYHELYQPVYKLTES